MVKRPIIHPLLVVGAGHLVVITASCVGPEPSYGDGGAGGSGSSSSVAPGTPGAACSKSIDCDSGLVCSQDVCCDSQCGNFCDSCLAEHTGKQPGKCEPVLAQTDPLDTCVGNGKACDGTDSGVCALVDGESCGAPFECISENCNQMVCEATE